MLLKTVIIGNGGHAGSWRGQIKNHKDFELVGIVDIQTEKVTDTVFHVFPYCRGITLIDDSPFLQFLPDDFLGHIVGMVKIDPRLNGFNGGHLGLPLSLARPHLSGLLHLRYHRF